jgi:hypothetical protein
MLCLFLFDHLGATLVDAHGLAGSGCTTYIQNGRGIVSRSRVPFCFDDALKKITNL